MTNQERAEKIIKGQPLGTTLDQAVKFCQEQLDEAVLEAVNKCVIINLKTAEESLAEGLKDGYISGFKDAREQAAGICDDHWSTPNSEIAERIRAMEADK